MPKQLFCNTLWGANAIQTSAKKTLQQSIIPMNLYDSMNSKTCKLGAFAPRIVPPETITPRLRGSRDRLILWSFWFGHASPWGKETQTSLRRIFSDLVLTDSKHENTDLLPGTSTKMTTLDTAPRNVRQIN